MKQQLYIHHLANPSSGPDFLCHNILTNQVKIYSNMLTAKEKIEASVSTSKYFHNVIC